MKFLFVFYTPSGGVETLNRERSQALKLKGIESHFLYHFKKKDLVNDHYAPVFITNEDKDIKQILNKENYDAIVITSDFHSIYRFRNFGYTGKIIFESQGYGSISQAKTVLEQSTPYVEKYADGLLNPKTSHIIKLLNKLLPKIPKYSFNNCLDSTKFKWQSSSKKPPHPIVAWVGRLEENKNWKEFLQIGHRLITNYNPEIQLYMFEDDTLSTSAERHDFENLVTNLRLHTNLSIFQNVPHPEMASYFSRIGSSGGMLCSTSKVEGATPFCVLEAMSCECPVLTTDSDGVRAAVINDRTGKYYNIGDIDDGANKAVELMSKKDLRKSIQKNALRHLKIHFSPALYAQNFSNAFCVDQMKKGAP